MEKGMPDQNSPKAEKIIIEYTRTPDEMKELERLRSLSNEEFLSEERAMNEQIEKINNAIEDLNLIVNPRTGSKRTISSLNEEKKIEKGKLFDQLHELNNRGDLIVNERILRTRERAERPTSPAEKSVEAEPKTGEIDITAEGIGLIEGYIENLEEAQDDLFREEDTAEHKERAQEISKDLKTVRQQLFEALMIAARQTANLPPGAPETKERMSEIQNKMEQLLKKFEEERRELMISPKRNDSIVRLRQIKRDIDEIEKNRSLLTLLS